MVPNSSRIETILQFLAHGRLCIVGICYSGFMLGIMHYALLVGPCCSKFSDLLHDPS